MTHDDSSYRVFKFTTHDWEGRELADLRQGAPIYALFEVFLNEEEQIYGRSPHPLIITDTLFDGKDDPIKHLKSQLHAMLADIDAHPLLEEPYPYADSGAADSSSEAHDTEI